MMKRCFTCLTILYCVFCCQNKTCGQYYFYNDQYYESAVTIEAGGSTGGMNCLTDLGGRKGAGKKFIKDINWTETHPCISMYTGLYYRNSFGLRLEISMGLVTASDDVLKNDRSVAHARFLRNLSFRSQVREALLLAEFHPLLMVCEKKGNSPLISPYVYAGIGCFAFNPEAKINNRWISLPALHTEGQGFKEYPGRKMYRLNQFNLPVGGGLRYEASPLLCVRFEITYRNLWTDYLDDVSTSYISPRLFTEYLPAHVAALARNLSDRGLELSTRHRRSTDEKRGNDKNNDAYFSFNIKLAVIMGRQKR